MEETKEMEVTQGAVEDKKKVRAKKIALISIMIGLVGVIATVVAFYIWKMNFYETHFLPNTYINGADCSELDAASVAEILEADARVYELSVLGRDENGNQVELGVITAEDIGLELQDGLAEANDLLSQQRAGNWLLTMLRKEEQHYNIVHMVNFDEKTLEKLVKSLDAFQEENMVAPADAYISEYLEDVGGYEIVPEVIGTQLDVELAFSCIKAFVSGSGDRVDLVEQECYASPAVLSTDADLLAAYETLNTWLGTEIIYDWNTFEVVVDGSLIKDWIIKEDNALKLDEEAIADFVATNAKKYDTYGKSRNFVTTLGVEVVLGNGGFGWRTDRTAETEELIALIEKGAVTDKEPVYNHTAPWHGMNDIGNSYVEADLTNQHLYLYYKGNLVFETDFVSGSLSATPDCVTPPGLFDITYKTTNAVLRGNNYETPVSYWMPFFGNYGMHDATWRTEFGGDIYITNGSHGCINLPLDSAATIYNYMYEGYPVICYYY